MGSCPVSEEEDEEKEPVKARVLQILKETYEIEEEDFLSAEIEIVPAGRARDLRPGQEHDYGLRP